MNKKGKRLTNDIVSLFFVDMDVCIWQVFNRVELYTL
ncbi:MAG: hypothetical protein ACI8V2_004982 [Candidatus Latescibacterota bacterium]|jgi:hypothetical protein